MKTLLILLYAAAMMVAGYVLPLIEKKQARILGWFLAVTTVVFSTLITKNEPALIRMVVSVALQLVSMKVLVSIETYSGKPRLRPWQWFVFSLGWFGMRPAPFESLPGPALPFPALLLKGFSRIGAGFIFLFLSEVTQRLTIGSKLFLPQLLMLAGFSLILHFGILNVSAAAWRSFGVPVIDLFPSPYRSRSLKEFWGRRWNLAFSEMTAVIAYRPLKRIIGNNGALIAAFLLSGLLHEIAISLPVMSGFGRPFTYFLIHVIALQLEARSPFCQKIISHSWLCHVWVMVWLVLPLPVLFHEAFLKEVLVPLRTLVLHP